MVPPYACAEPKEWLHAVKILTKGHNGGAECYGDSPAGKPLHFFRHYQGADEQKRKKEEDRPECQKLN
jgi:hypothetical protein